MPAGSPSQRGLVAWYHRIRPWHTQNPTWQNKMKSINLAANEITKRHIIAFASYHSSRSRKHKMVACCKNKKQGRPEKQYKKPHASNEIRVSHKLSNNARSSTAQHNQGSNRAAQTTRNRIQTQNRTQTRGTRKQFAQQNITA